MSKVEMLKYGIFYSSFEEGVEAFLVIVSCRVKPSVTIILRTKIVAVVER
jgi:hypothetical protein